MIEKIFFMTNRFLIFLLAVFVMSPGMAFAQACHLDEEVIYKLRAPTLGAYNIWDGAHGEEDSDETYVYGDLLPDTGHVIVTGERYASGSKNPKLIIAEIDRRGRLVWEGVHDIDKLSHVRKLMRLDEQVVVLGALSDGPRSRAVWIGFFDLKGKHGPVRQSI